MGNAGMYFVGTVELVGGIGLLIPRLMGLAATCFVVHMTLAVILTLVTFPGPLVLIPATVLVLVAIVAWGRRDNTKALIAPLRR